MGSSPLWFIFTLVQCLQIALALKGDSACMNSICVDATVEGDLVTYELTPLLDPVGWVAVGFGKRMINTHSVVMWHNEDGSTTLSQRYASGYFEPRPVRDPPRLAKIVEPRKSASNSGRPKFAFQIPVNRSLLANADPRENLVFAYSSTRPNKDPDSSLFRHRHVGHLQFDLTKEFVQVPSTPIPTKSKDKTEQGTNANYKRIEKLIIVHGFLVSLGFLVILPAGSLIGRWGRAFTPKWFKAHWISNMAVALPVITFGVLLGPVIVYSKESFRIHFANDHEVGGVFLLFAYYAQVLLGRFIHNRRQKLAQLGPITQPHPPLNILHIALGVTIIALAFFQVRSGLEWWETLTGRGPITSWALPLWKIWIIVFPIAYFAGYALLPRQLRQEREAAYEPILAPAEEPSQTDRLLAEEES
ncbi:hypothetical protein M413DRAFT_88681 [Hebeloma cylindrosporum]|uniref:DOMON domain-containing protein n=1 Tax=Hebeloma cylindrosporum TaxID=76867 RepID=A0A0C2YGN7_HEBCY|nr:hypothetical protein M413DRAFT_88681 [Hebeloma cylindrosporum h7]